MAESTYLDFNQRLHGSGIAHCGSYPDIKAVGRITFTREAGSPTVTWAVSGMSRSSCLPSTTAMFGYRFLAYIEVNGVRSSLIIKDNTQGSNWTSSKWTKIYTPSGSFTSTADTVTVRLVTKGNTCQSGGAYCYRTSGYYEVRKYTVDLPTYAAYTIDYDTGKGSPTPASQPKVPQVDITLTNEVPTFPVAINYHNDIVNTESANHTFDNWECSADHQIYAPGSTYRLDESCTMEAQWGGVVFTPSAMIPKYYRVNFIYNGGVEIAPYSDIERNNLGYSNSSGSTTIYCQPGVSKTESDSDIEVIDLYPVYGDATVIKNNLPVSTKTNYIFDGWYRDAQLTDKVTRDFDISGNITLYAKWRDLPIRQFDGGSWNSISSYVWKFNAAENKWEKVAHVFGFNGTSWEDMSQ